MEEINLRDFFEYLKKYVLVFIAAALVAVGGAFVYNKEFKTPLYTASSSIVLYQSDSESTSATLNEINVGQKLASTYAELIKSELILQKVIDNLRLDTTYAALNKNVTVSTEDNTMLLTIKVKDADPEKAAEIANEIAEVFTETTISKFNINNISVWGEAKVPTSPSNMTMTRDMLLAGLIAVFGVLAIAFLIFYFDDTIKYTEDIADRVGLPVAGKVVKSDITRKIHTPGSVQVANTKSDKTTTDSGAKIPSELVVEKHPKAAVSESIKSLRTNLQFTSVDQDLKTILITSTLPGEGKSFVSLNLAASFAQTDKKVLLVDCDLRRGRLHKVFDLPNINGLSNLLADDIVNMNRYIQDTGIENLSVITRGTCPPNPSELLSSKKNKDLLKKLSNRFDLIIFDGTPVNGLTDSIIMSTLVDETLIVIRNAFTPRSALTATKESLEKVGAKVAGIVPNAVAKKTASYYTYYSDDKD